MSTPAVLGWSEGQPITSLQELLDYWSAVGQHKLWLAKENIDRMRNDVTALLYDVAYIRTVVDDIQLEIGDISVDSGRVGWTTLGVALDSIKDEIIVIDTVVDGIDTVVDAIKLKTDTILWTDVTTIDTVVDAIYTRIGAPAGASVSADIAAVKTVVDNTYTRIGAPAGASVSADIAALKTVADNIYGKVDTEVDAIYTRIGAPVGASISVDIAAIKTELDDGTNGLAAIKTAVSTVSGYVDTMEADLETWMTTNIVTNYLADATYGLSAIHIDIAAIQTEVGDISVDSGRVGWTTLGVALNDIKEEIEYIYDMVGYIEEDTMDIYDAVYDATYGLSAIHTDVTAIRAGDTVTSLTGTDVVVTFNTSTDIIASGASPFWGTLTISGTDNTYSIEAYVGNNWCTILDPANTGNSITVSGTGLRVTADNDAADVTVDYVFVYHSNTG